MPYWSKRLETNILLLFGIFVKSDIIIVCFFPPYCCCVPFMQLPRYYSTPTALRTPLSRQKFKEKRINSQLSSFKTDFKTGFEVHRRSSDLQQVCESQNFCLLIFKRQNVRRNEASRMHLWRKGEANHKYNAFALK